VPEEHLALTVLVVVVEPVDTPVRVVQEERPVWVLLVPLVEVAVVAVANLPQYHLARLEEEVLGYMGLVLAEPQEWLSSLQVPVVVVE
jgi:hypothetical protein